MNSDDIEVFFPSPRWRNLTQRGDGVSPVPWLIQDLVCYPGVGISSSSDQTSHRFVCPLPLWKVRCRVEWSRPERWRQCMQAAARKHHFCSRHLGCSDKALLDEWNNMPSHALIDAELRLSPPIFFAVCSHNFNFLQWKSIKLQSNHPRPPVGKQLGRLFAAF